MKLTLPDTTVELRSPRAQDGAAIWQLVRDAGVLDLNSPYAYFLLGEHFADTSIVAERDGEITGFVSAYLHPKKTGVLFVWQVGIASSMRKQGLALQMILALLRRDACSDVDTIETTITPSNKPSRALFAAVARAGNCEMNEKPDHFRAEWFPGEGHEAESLFVIGPIRLKEAE